MQVSASEFGKSCFTYILVNLANRCSVKNWCGEFQAHLFTGPSENSFVNLAEVHSGRNAQRVQHDVNGCAFLKERHVFIANNFRNDTFITMTSCHLIANSKLTLLSNLNLSKLHDARRQFVTNGESKFFPLMNT